MAVDLEDIRNRLSKKAAFENAVADLQKLLGDNPSLTRQDAVFDLLKRIMVLLKTRFTSPAFWRAGRALYETAKEKDPEAARMAKYNEFIQACAEHLGELPGSSTADRPAVQGPQHQSYLFEGQMSSEQEPPPRRRGMEDILMALAERARASEAATAGDQDSDPTVSSSAPESESGAASDQQGGALPSLAQLEEEMAVALAEALAESEAMGGQQPSHKPPASKHAVRALTREKLSAQRLKQLGGPDAQCSVCREDLEVGDEVQIMPCNDGHVFHPPCLKPWLRDNNSCPVCRHELPTDDDSYERQKERDRENAAGAKGAANAVQHNEFTFV